MRKLSELSTEHTEKENDFEVEIDEVFGAAEDSIIGDCPWTCSWTCSWTGITQ